MITDRAPPLANWIPELSPVDPKLAGSVRIDNLGPFEAGSYQTFTLTYRAGRYGIDDTGSLKIAYRFASDQGYPQFKNATAPNYVTVRASNNAALEARFDPKLNTRPWDRTIFIKVMRGYLKEGDEITVIFGDRSGGSPGLRMQTFADPHFHLRVLVDPVATYTYTLIPGQLVMPIVAGPRHSWRAVLPTCRATGEKFWFGVRTDDKWGNPSGKGLAHLRLHADRTIDTLPEAVRLDDGVASLRLEGLVARTPGSATVEIQDPEGKLLARSNPIIIREAPASFKPFWGDLHAQSAETIGTGTAREYFEFSRDMAFLDIVSHQANDMQITPEFWSQLNGLMAEFNKPGSFVTVPGYEWSGNTPLGGDRNVFYFTEDRPIRRSSHALVADRSDIETDCYDAKALFTALRKDNENAIVWAHCGGRYADIKYAHDHDLERSVEVHSSWGTFEWLVNDAFDLGYRVGIVGNSDGHKGRPGSEPPGASQFGAIGGLTCYLLPELTRSAAFDAMRARHHYATTGCRLHLNVRASLTSEGDLFHDDPRTAGAKSSKSRSAMMGDIVVTGDRAIELSVEIVAAAPIISLEFRNGRDIIETIYPEADLPLGRRVRVIWSGAEYRGRFRQLNWDGKLTIEDNAIVSVVPINFFNLDRPLRKISEQELQWRSITTGNFAGVEMILEQPLDGRIRLETVNADTNIFVKDLSLKPRSIDCGKLDARIGISRHPDQHGPSEATVSRRLTLKTGDNPFYVCATLADGHQVLVKPDLRRDAMKFAGSIADGPRYGSISMMKRRTFMYGAMSLAGLSGAANDTVAAADGATLGPLVWPTVTKAPSGSRVFNGHTDTVIDVVGRIGPPPKSCHLHRRQSLDGAPRRRYRRRVPGLGQVAAARCRPRSQ